MDDNSCKCNNFYFKAFIVAEDNVFSPRYASVYRTRINAVKLIRLERCNESFYTLLYPVNTRLRKNYTGMRHS